MYYNPQKLIETARAEVGYLEKKSNKNLDDKTANAGSANYTKYGRDLRAWLGKITGDTFGVAYAWCGQFVAWVFITAFGLDAAKKLLGGWSAYTPVMAQYFEDMGRLSQTPCVGAVVFFYHPSKASSSRPHGIYHTGLVIDVGDDYIKTIEGNTSSQNGVVENGGCVAIKTYDRRYSKIYGYGVPKFGAPDEEPAKVEVEMVKDKERYIKDLYLLIFGRPVDTGGLKTWTAYLEAGGDVGDMLVKMAHSEELCPECVAAAYHRRLGRDPEESEIEIWDTAADGKLSISEIDAKIAKSPEAKEKG